MKNFILTLLLLFMLSRLVLAEDVLPSNESFYRESAMQQNTINSELKKNTVNNLNKSLNKSDKTNNKNKTNINTINQKSLTNYQYDEANYHYYKFQKYIQDNINYSKSGRMKY